MKLDMQCYWDDIFLWNLVYRVIEWHFYETWCTESLGWYIFMKLDMLTYWVIHFCMKLDMQCHWDDIFLLNLVYRVTRWHLFMKLDVLNHWYDTFLWNLIYWVIGVIHFYETWYADLLGDTFLYETWYAVSLGWYIFIKLGLPSH